MRVLNSIWILTVLTGCSDSLLTAHTNIVPNVSIIDPSDDAVTSTTALLALSGIVSDENGLHTLSLATWHSDVDGVLATAESEALLESMGHVETWVQLSAGRHKITLDAIDDAEARGEDWIFVTVERGDVDGDGFTVEDGDCDDDDPDIFPGADEHCDGEDENCNGQIDEDPVDPTLWYPDADTDGFGDASGPIEACTQPPGYAADNTDCDDANATIHPGADEHCDGIDEDCDGELDNNPIDGSPIYIDGAIDRTICAAASCLDQLNTDPSSPDGIYWIDPDGTSAFEAYCLMDATYDGGGWTLVMVSSDDGVDTWTWDNRELLTTDTTTLGNLTDLDRDFKSPALHRLIGAHMLFIHNPSSLWASYDNVGNGSQSYGDVIEDTGPVCYSSSITGYPMSHGTLTKDRNLVETTLYINSEDGDGDSTCSTISNNDAWGPSWNLKNNNGNHDDPGLASLGPDSQWPSSEGTNYGTTVYPKVGWGWANRTNTGAWDSGANHMRVFVRE